MSRVRGVLLAAALASAACRNNQGEHATADDVRVKAPPAPSPSPSPDGGYPSASCTLDVILDAKGAIFVDGKPVTRARLEAIAKDAELIARVNDSECEVTIHPDDATQAAVVKEVFATIARAGVSKIRFGLADGGVIVPF